MILFFNWKINDIGTNNTVIIGVSLIMFGFTFVCVWVCQNSHTSEVDQEMIIYWGLVAGRCVGGAIDLGGSGETRGAKRPRLGVDWLAEGKM